MFKVRNSGKVDLDGCETNSETMVDADNVDYIKARDCIAGQRPGLEKTAHVSRGRLLFNKVVDKILDNIITLAVGAAVAVFFAAIGFS